MAEAFQLHIGGAFRAAEGGATFDSIDPSTEEVWADAESLGGGY